ncbi:MAG: oxaloacetate decarboxylase subunit gamma [Desulfosporosinus sp. BRH_c37]|nr:MAG: oxaloacetate decarboxylase subunit gamma [Desulfosporosinus sp. BRH_c37]
MSLPLTTFITGLSGVFIVMTFLLIFVKLSSKLAIALERKQETEKQN